MTKKGTALKLDYQWQCKEQYKSLPILCDVKLTVELYFGDKKIRDIDNYNKIVLDACTGILWDDDSQIQEITIKKFYDKKNPRIELVVL
jgi:Holliday junction resolvase RusA-like endonuclease